MVDAQTLFAKSNLDKQRPFRGEVSADHVRRGIMSYRIDSETGAVRETVVHALPPNVNPMAPHASMTFAVLTWEKEEPHRNVRM